MTRHELVAIGVAVEHGVEYESVLRVVVTGRVVINEVLDTIRMVVLAQIDLASRGVGATADVSIGA